MPDTLILIESAGTTYRFLKLSLRPDGSLVLLVDRLPTPVEIGGEPIPQAKYTIHTTGTINFYPDRKTLGHRCSIDEPLTDLTGFHLVAVYSIPHVTRLDVLADGKIKGPQLTIKFSNPLEKRFTVYVEVGPNAEPKHPENVIAQLFFELYSLVLRFGRHPDDAVQKPNHFFTAAVPLWNMGSTLRLKPSEAELRFHQKVHKGRPPVFRNGDGSYTWLAAREMRVSPKLTVVFNRPDLRIEQVPFDYGLPSHKVRFWILDRGGRNRRDDLSQHIVSIALDARL